MYLYRVRFIHRQYDWDAEFQFAAPDAKTARKWAAMKLANQSDWLFVEARRK